MSGQAGRYQRSTAGMIGAMIVLVALVAVFVVVRDLLRDNPATPVRTVDYQKSVEYARTQADYPVLAPERLPEGWRATSATFVPQTGRWHLGVLTEEDKYVGLEQARSGADTMVEEYVDEEAVRGGTVRVGGDSWTTWTDEGGDTALARSEQGVTTLVVGTIGKDALVEYVESLR